MTLVALVEALAPVQRGAVEQHALVPRRDVDHAEHAEERAHRQPPLAALLREGRAEHDREQAERVATPERHPAVGVDGRRPERDQRDERVVQAEPRRQPARAEHQERDDGDVRQVGLQRAVVADDAAQLARVAQASAMAAGYSRRSVQHERREHGAHQRAEDPTERDPGVELGHVPGLGRVLGQPSMGDPAPGAEEGDVQARQEPHRLVGVRDRREDEHHRDQAGGAADDRRRRGHALREREHEGGQVDRQRHDPEQRNGREIERERAGRAGEEHRRHERETDPERTPLPGEALGGRRRLHRARSAGPEHEDACGRHPDRHHHDTPRGTRSPAGRGRARARSGRGRRRARRGSPHCWPRRGSRVARAWRARASPEGAVRSRSGG